MSPTIKTTPSSDVSIRSPSSPTSDYSFFRFNTGSPSPIRTSSKTRALFDSSRTRDDSVISPLSPRRTSLRTLDDSDILRTRDDSDILRTGYNSDILRTRDNSDILRTLDNSKNSLKNIKDIHTYLSNIKNKQIDFNMLEQVINDEIQKINDEKQKINDERRKLNISNDNKLFTIQELPPPQSREKSPLSNALLNEIRSPTMLKKITNRTPIIAKQQPQTSLKYLKEKINERREKLGLNGNYDTTSKKTNMPDQNINRPLDKTESSSKQAKQSILNNAVLNAIKNRSAKQQPPSKQDQPPSKQDQPPSKQDQPQTSQQKPFDYSIINNMLKQQLSSNFLPPQPKVDDDDNFKRKYLKYKNKYFTHKLN